MEPIPMRRTRQQLSPEECSALLEQEEYGILALNTGAEYPYPLPINYVWADGKLYFHCAKKGYKLDVLTNNTYASFCVVGRHDIIQDAFTTAYQSVIVYGKAHIVTEEEERRFALNAMVECLTAEIGEETGSFEVDNCILKDNVEILVLVPDCITGKQGKSLL